jgi:hypothetical protein
MQAVEMIGNGAVIGFHAGNPDRWHADRHGGAGEQSKNFAAGDWHGGITKRLTGRKASGVIWRRQGEHGTCGKICAPPLGKDQYFQMLDQLDWLELGKFP